MARRPRREAKARASWMLREVPEPLAEQHAVHLLAAPPPAEAMLRQRGARHNEASEVPLPRGQAKETAGGAGGGG